MKRRVMAMAAAAAVLTGCRDERIATAMPIPGGASAAATLHDDAGRAIGRAVAVEAGGGLRVTLDARGLAPGRHGARIQTDGRCGASGGERYPGDLPVLVVGADGRGTVGAVIPGATIAALLDGEGAAMVVAADADDPMADPAVRRGVLACGIFARR